MNAEQTVRDFLSTFETRGVEASIPYLADQLTLTADNPPLQGGRDEFIGQGQLIKLAMPDFRWGIQKLSTQGNQVTVNMHWTGTHTGTFKMSAFMPGAPDIPATGVRVGAPDTFIFTVSGDKISGVHITSPANGGLPEMLKQIGVELPS